ncbi:MAG: hypothetical protein V1918_07625 [Planctomycetota bacterium]
MNSIFEALMMVCWGIGWPISILKSLRTKVVVGKSPLYMSVVATGYLSGIFHKWLYNLDYVTVLYAFNFFLVLFDLYLYYRYLPPAGKAPIGDGLLPPGTTP